MKEDLTKLTKAQLIERINRIEHRDQYQINLRLIFWQKKLEDYPEDDEYPKPFNNCRTVDIQVPGNFVLWDLIGCEWWPKK